MTNQRIRVSLHQPALPKYRVPVFRELAARPGIDLTVHYGEGLPGPSNAPADGFKAEVSNIREIPSPLGTLFWSSDQIRLASRRHTDVLILNANNRYQSLVPSLLRAKASGVRTILWGHFYSKNEQSVRRWLRGRIPRLADCLLFYNHTAAHHYIESGFDPGRVFVALNAIDQTPVQAARRQWLDRPDDLAAFRTEHGLNPGPVILYVSRLEQANRVDLLLEAGVILRQHFPGLRIVIVGKGEPESQRLRDLVGKLALQEHVLFPGAIYDEMEIAPWFLSADVFCYPANIGLSILHAFGYGLPVVTSDQIESQNPEIEALRDGENGVLYRHGNAADLAGKLQSLLADPPARASMQQAALKTALEQFTLSNMVDGMEAAIRFCGGGNR